MSSSFRSEAHCCKSGRLEAASSIAAELESSLGVLRSYGAEDIQEMA
jgi:hypothetical protein